jgi:CheY-like chemotaxis protein
MNPQVKIVLCSTGSAESHDLIIEGLKAGASEILLKPLEQKKILELVGKLAVS